jgi:MFS transporter, Spinster family, sphingosine-1-phosphate transporter
MAIRIKPAWLLAILTGLNLFNYIDRYLLNGVLTPIQQEFALTDAQLGRLNTAFMVGYFFTSPFFGYLGDRRSRKLLIALGVGIGSLGTIATSWAPTYLALLMVRMLVGLGEASYASVCPSLISDTFYGRSRNLALSVFYVGLPLGAALGYIISGQLHELIGWRGAFLWVGLASLLLTFILQPFEEPKRGQAEGLEASYVPSTVLEALRLGKLPAYVLCVGGYIAYTFAMGALAVWAPIFLHRYHGQTNAQATLFFGAVAVVTGILGTLAGGFAASQYRKRNAAAYEWTLLLSVLVALPVVIVALRASDLFLVKWAFGAAMFLLFLSTGPVNSVILDSVPINLRSTAVAVSIFSIHLFGDLWSPEFVGFLSTRFGNLRSAMVVVPIAFGASSLLWAALLYRGIRSPKAQ